MKKCIFLVFIYFIVSAFAFTKTLEKTSGTITGNYSNYENRPNYSLEITMDNENACVKKNDYWILKAGEKINIKYSSACVGGGGGSEYGSGGSSDYTILIIKDSNNKEINYKNEIIIKANEIYVINLFHKHSATYSQDYEELLFSVKIIADGICPTPPRIRGAVGTWTKENVTLTASESSDDKSGLNHYEYKVGASEWQSGSTCAVAAEEGQIVETEVKFRAVDNVGNASKEVTATVKIDRTKPVISADKESGKWTKEDIKINAIDSGSGVKRITVTKDGRLYNPAVENTLSESGRYTVKAADNAGNESDEVTYLIDKTKPQIELNGYEEGVWTNKDVTITFTDAHSGIKSVTVNEEAVSWENGYTITQSGEYSVKCTDNTGNENTAAIKIDKISPSVSGLSFSSFGYEEKDETKYLNSFAVNYNVTEADSGIKENNLYLNGAKTNESTEKSISYKESRNLAELTREENDKTFEYKALVTDKAGNTSGEVKGEIVIPRKIIIKAVESEDENQGIRKSYIKDGYTINGILINKINFSLYKEIRLKRTFLADKGEGEVRRTFTYEDYKSRFDVSVSEQTVRENWEREKEVVISEKDVKSVSIGGTEYWYLEDKIKTDSGLGHRGIRYQVEWVWKEYDVTERGEYLVTAKSANNAGRMKIRIEGTEPEGKEKRYIVLDNLGNIIEGESDDDFIVPLNGVVRLSVKVEDEDFDNYNIEATELVKAMFKNTDGVSEEMLLTVAMRGAVTGGYIEKVMEGGKINSQFKASSGKIEKWYEFKNPEVKLYYNKPFNMKITMTEGCNGDGGAYKDVTESGVIRLKAGAPDLGGFKLLVGEEAGYNEDGITARPHQEIELGIEMTEDAEGTYKILWDYGDGTIVEGGCVTHHYGQSSERKGNTSEYVLTITAGSGLNEKNASVNVHIVDTQYGALLGDEEWIGMHPLLGKIQVPEGKTLTVSDNGMDEDNPTIILGYGSPLEERKGLLEVMRGGRLCVNTQGVKFTEGKNGLTFTEVKTEKEGGEDESLKWGGIIIRGGSEASYIKNAEIKYAVNGITAEEGSAANLNNILIDNCPGYGLKAGGEIKADSIEIASVKCGLLIEKEGSVSVEGSLTIGDVVQGIECEGSLKAGSVNLEGDGRCGIENEEGAVLLAGDSILVKGFENGIINKGSIKAESLKIKARGGRGYISGSGSRAKFEESEIEAEEIGIHCTGNAEAEFGKSRVKALRYGIKSDRDEKGSPSIKLDEGSVIEGAAVLWYDWEGGVLTDEEIEEKLGTAE